MEIEKFEFDKFKKVILSNVKDKKLLFHCSPMPGLTSLQPRLSAAYKNGTKKCVFASYHLHSILFYGSKKHNGDFDGRYGVTYDGKKAYFKEAYVDAIERVYKGEKCYIYIVDQQSSNFQEGQTSYPAEVVDGTGNDVKLVKCYEVEDIYDLMLQFEKEGLMIFKHFRDYTKEERLENTEYQKMILKRIDAFNPENSNKNIVKHCLQNYIDALKEIESEKVL